MLQIFQKSLQEIYENPLANLSFWVNPYQGHLKHQSNINHFLTFLKPELTALDDQVNIEALLKFVFNHYEKWNVKIGGIRILSGAYLENKHIIPKNYETLFKISHEGEKACSESIVNNLHKLINQLKTNENIKVAGGHQFIKKYPEVTPKKLNDLILHAQPYKLGAGAYAVIVNYDHSKYILLNAFHPYQIETLMQKGRAVVAIESFSETDWETLRYAFIGSINPEKAAPNSFRRLLFEQQQKLNIKYIDISYNGIHISPGPIEAMFQIKNFFSDNEEIKIDSTTLGNSLLKAGLNLEQIFLLQKNPHVHTSQISHETTLFEATENYNFNNVLHFLNQINLYNAL